MNPTQNDPEWSPEQQRREDQRSHIKPAMSTDPVCGVEVRAGEDPALKATFSGETYDFCSAECRDKFQANPQRYVVAH